MNIYPFQAQYPIIDLLSSPDLFVDSVKNEYSSHNSAGYYNKTAVDSLYICKIKSKFGEHVGIIASNASSDLEAGKILKHENTLESKEQSMISFLLQTRAMVKPVLLAHEPIQRMEDMFDAYINKHNPFLEIQFNNNSETHSFWAISDGKMIDEIQTIFKNEVKQCYIADGHHRCSATLRLMQSTHLHHIQADLSGIMCIYFPYDQLNILDYNKSIDILNEIQPALFMAKLSNVFKIKVIKVARKPRKKHEIILLMEGITYQLVWKDKILEKHKKDNVILDAELLNDYVLMKIMDVKDVRADDRISYIEGEITLDETIKKMKTLPSQATFFLYPVQIEELVKIADAGETLPPKSTWFEPRIKSGLIVKEF